MELQQLELGSKVKLQLIQPKFMCSGRDEVTCHYKGKIIEKLDDSLLIQFKYKGIIRNELYYTSEPLKFGFYDEDLRDIKIMGS